MISEKFEYIMAIVEEQNITRAAHKLFVSQPTLTHYLNRLEAELGAKLFDRSKNPVLPTSAGEYYIKHMLKLLGDEQAVRDNVRTISNPTRVFRIGIGQVRGIYWLPQILPYFCSIHPNVDIQAVTKPEVELEAALYKYHLDIAIGTIPFFSADYRIENLFAERMVLCAHRKYGLIPDDCRQQYSPANPYVIQPEALEGLPFIEPANSNGISDNFRQLFQKYHIKSGRTIVTSNQHLGFSLAVAGLGVQMLFCSAFSANGFELNPDIDCFILEGMNSSRKCVAVYHDNSANLSLIQDFIRIIRNEILPVCVNIDPV